MPNYTQRNSCRICEGSLETILDMGTIAISDFVKNELDAVYAPLCVVKCTRCSLVQLLHTVDQDKMYRQYWYQSSLNPSMKEALKDIVVGIEDRIELEDGDVVYDIACNDGTLFNYYSKKVYKIGIDPAENLAKKAMKNCDLFVNGYFEYAPDMPKAKVVTSIAVFYDLENPRQFVADVKKVLDKEGIWVIQLTDLLSTIKANAFDNFCHEHLEYYTVEVIQNLLAEYDLEIFDLEVNDVNGSSVRLYISHTGDYDMSDNETIPTSVDFYLDEENFLINRKDGLRKFVDHVKKLKLKLKKLVNDLKGRRIFVLGASTKGNTLLQYVGLTSKDFEYALEVNEDKFGLMTAGTNIPIISQEEGLKMKPDYLFVLPWHFKTFFKTKFRNRSLIFPLPKLEIWKSQKQSN